jgi:hypothetical protein
LLDRIVGPNPEPINTMDYLDCGVARAFGMVGGFKVRSADGQDVNRGEEAADGVRTNASGGLFFRSAERDYDCLRAQFEQLDLERAVAGSVRRTKSLDTCPGGPKSKGENDEGDRPGLVWVGPGVGV